MDWVQWILAFIGHLGLWCVIFNRVHATALPRSTRKLSEKFVIAAVAIPILCSVIWMLRCGSVSFDEEIFHWSSCGYAYACVLLGVFFVSRWIWRKMNMGLPASVIESRREIIDIGKDLGIPLFHGSLAKMLGRLPFNEVLKLSLQRITFELEVPKSLDGFRICQLSDLHFTGQIGVEYFQRIVEEANKFDPDLTIITGDLVDELECIDWIDQALSKLSAKHGVVYVLGNHDLRIKNETMLRERLHNSGLVQASGTWINIEHGGAKIQLTGNELPWYKDAERLTDAGDETAALRILLSHSPDQIEWAKPKNFDLMFAGHTHGGQIAFPIIGPVVAPSRYGVLYASGTFQIDDMVMHVSRGISGDEPIRFCSPPELGLFTIRAKPTDDS